MAKKKAEATEPTKTNGDGPAETPKAPADPGAGAKAAHPQLTVLAQYVKDLSFESPNAPQALQGPGENPQLKVGVNVGAVPKGDDAYEVALNLEVHARSDNGVIYNVEMVYGGLFRLRGVLVRDAHEHDVGGTRDAGGRIRGLRALLDERQHLVAAAVPDRDCVAGGEQPQHHGLAHQAQADETQARPIAHRRPPECVTAPRFAGPTRRAYFSSAPESAARRGARQALRRAARSRSPT